MDRAGLFRLVDRSGANLAPVLEHFMVERAVLVVDMSSFSRITLDQGIAGALLAIRKLQLTADGMITAHGGRLVKADADNLFAVFPEARQALWAARRILSTIPSSAGVGYGQMLLLDDDLYGDEVNRASKLGEDVAHGEVLLTPAAQAQMHPSPMAPS